MQILSNQQDSSEDFTYAHLRADCGNCFGLCCVALPFAATTDFAIDKEGESLAQTYRMIIVVKSIVI